MVEKPTDPKFTPPPSSGGGIPQGPAKASNSPPQYQGGQLTAKPMTFLGMYFDSDQAKKLWGIFIQMINTQISKDKEKAIAAIRKLRDDQDS